MRCTSFAFNIQRHLVSAPKIACSINNENRTNKSDRETWNKLKLAFFASIIHWMTSSDPYISGCITSYGISKVASHVAVCVNYANFGRNIRLNSRMTIIKPESYNLCLDMISLSIRWAWVWMQNFDKILTSSSGFFPSFISSAKPVSLKCIVFCGSSFYVRTENGQKLSDFHPKTVQ